MACEARSVPSCRRSPHCAPKRRRRERRGRHARQSANRSCSSTASRRRARSGAARRRCSPRTRRVVTLDVPGFGARAARRPRLRSRAVADRVARDLRAAGVPEPFDLAGHSMGAAVALTLAARHPRGRPQPRARVPRRAAPAAARRRRRGSASRAELFIPARRRAAPLATWGWGRRLLMSGGVVDGAALAPDVVRELVGDSRGARRIGAGARGGRPRRPAPDARRAADAGRRAVGPRRSRHPAGRRAHRARAAPRRGLRGHRRRGPHRDGRAARRRSPPRSSASCRHRALADDPARARRALNAAHLRDGRRLAYRAIGPAGGPLVLYFHGAIGAPQSSRRARVDRRGARHPLRPRQPARASAPPTRRRRAPCTASRATSRSSPTRWTRPLRGRRRVCGGPYALACAHELPDRVEVASVVSCMVPGGRPCAELPAPARLGLRALRARPRACSRAGDALLALARRHPGLLARTMYPGAAATTGGCSTSPARARSPRSASSPRRAAASRGWSTTTSCAPSRGASSRPHRPARPGLARRARRARPVDEAMALAASLSRARIALHPDEGHFFYGRRLREILGAVAAPPRARRSAGRAAASTSRTRARRAPARIAGGSTRETRRAAPRAAE